MGAWTLGRDAALFNRDASLPPSRRDLNAADPRTEAEKKGVEPTPKEKSLTTLAEYAGKVIDWIPAEVVVVYGALITAIVTKAGDDASVVLTIIGFVLAAVLVPLSAFSNSSKPGWFTKRVKLRAVLAPLGFLIWSLTVPNSGWSHFQAIADNPAWTAGIAGVLGMLFALFATGADKHWGTE